MLEWLHSNASILQIGANISIIGTFVVTFIIFYISNKKQTSISISKELYKLELLFFDHHKLLRFHGITEEDLKRHNLSHSDFAYLVSTFTVLSMYYRTTSYNKVFYDGSYLNNMFKTEDTIKAWPLVRRMFYDKGKFVQQIDNMHEAMNIKNANM